MFVEFKKILLLLPLTKKNSNRVTPGLRQQTGMNRAGKAGPSHPPVSKKNPYDILLCKCVAGLCPQARPSVILVTNREAPERKARSTPRLLAHASSVLCDTVGAMKGNPKVIAELNKALREELTAINQYFLHAEMCENWGYHKLSDFIKKQSIGEMKHAEVLIERILFLDGSPSMQPLELTVGGQ